MTALFGAAPPASRVTAEDPGGVGAVAVEDCYSTLRIGSRRWQQVYGAAGAGLDTDPSGWLSGAGLTRADHVAIDRWTGGAAGGRLYSVLEPGALGWEPIRMTVDLTRLERAAGTAWAAAMALLVLLLRDFAAGRVPLGFATHRGFGDVVVREIRLYGPDWPDGTTLEAQHGTAWWDSIGRAWQAYLEEPLP